MDKNKIIEEGLLQLYLLGELSIEQHSMVENAIENDTELAQLYRALEDNFERMAFENAIEPPSTIKIALKNTLGPNPNAPQSKPTTKKKVLTARLAVAASLAALFGLSSFWFYTKWQDTEQNLQVLQKETLNLQDRLALIEKDYKSTQNKYNVINNPNVIPLLLKGDQSRAVAYVNHTTKEVVLNPQGLPKLESDKTYQMWADVDGEMINMGIVPTDKELVTLRYIDKAESLNITIEPAGGNDHATVENLVSNIIL
ncbi:anti-sigma factor domain-containing protein [Costertonia aggregata]|uniref:Anti-sigma factor n=1 Tax=Costertonia aggregata TaxID=343403 RepID=A0A7H9AL34_9FLAO|nr:anti-sigma factor [Costertonia aggregata]QLG44179.1 anti-sigma factor [Costertonia aggregata]